MARTPGPFPAGEGERAGMRFLLNDWLPVFIANWLFSMDHPPDTIFSR